MDLIPITIIGTPISHYVQTVILTCEEKGVPYRLKIEGHDTPVALSSAAHRQWHPFAKIPAMAQGGVVLYETSAICRYIDLAFGGPALVPDEPLAAARMEQWISAISAYFHTPCVSQLVSQYVFPRGPGGQPDPRVIDAALPAINTALQTLADAYAESPYLAGDQLSLADLFAAPVILQMQQTPEGQACLRRFSAIERRVAQLAERSSFGKMGELHRRHLPAGNRLLNLPYR